MGMPIKVGMLIKVGIPIKVGMLIKVGIPIKVGIQGFFVAATTLLLLYDIHCNSQCTIGQGPFKVPNSELTTLIASHFIRVLIFAHVIHLLLRI